MLKLTIKLIPIRAFKLLLKLLASLASAIVVVSGYLFFVSNMERNRDSNIAIRNHDAPESDVDVEPKED